MRVLGDFSDNNRLPLPLSGLAGAMLKLYPEGTRGGDWLLAAFAQASLVFPQDRIGFYAPGDVTPLWIQQKAAAAAIGVDLHDHPWALDLEFGYTPETVRAVMASAKADGMTCRGLYQRKHAALGQTWDWRSIGGHRDGNTFPNMVLDQFATDPFDHDQTTLDDAEWAAATISRKEPADVTPEQVNAQIAAALAVLHAPGDSAVYALRFQGYYDRQAGAPAPRKPDEPHYMDGWNLPAAATHTHETGPPR